MGKARSFSDAANDTVYQTGINSENYSMGQQNTYNLGSVHFTDQSGIGNFSQAGSDQRKASLSGALFLGNLGFDLQTVELDVGTFTINLNNDSAGVVLSVISTDRFVTLSAGSTGDLVTITGAQRPGQRLRLYNTTTNTITIKHTAAATVNTIRTPDGTDLTFPGNGVIDFTFDITSTQWRVVGNVGGTGGLSEPIILTINTITPQTLPTTSVIDWSKNPNQITIDRDVEFSFSNLPSSGSYEGIVVIIDIDGIGGFAAPVWPAAVTNPPIIDTTANTRSTVVLYTIDGGTVVTNATSTSSANLLPLNNIWTGSNTFNGSPFIINGAITTLASTTSTSITSPLIVLGDGITDTINFGGRIGTDIIPILDADDDLGTNVLRWNNIFGVNVIASTVTASVSLSSTGSTFLGDAITDTISFGGRINTDVIPILDADDDLGTNVLRWNNIFGVSVIANTVTASVSLSSTGNTILGDDIADTISFGGRVNTDIIPILTADDDLGTTILRWNNIFGISVIANTVTASVSFSSTGTTTLGDDAADNIFFGGQVATQMVIEEISVPGTPPANTVTLYGKDDGGTSSLFFKDDSGTEFNLNAAGGAGANTALSNLASVAINTSLLPAGDGTINLGSAANSWLDTFTERIRIETGGVSTSTANQIISDTGGMVFNVPVNDRYEFNISGSPNGIAIEEDRIEFLTSGRQHRIDATGASINILSQNITDSVEIWTGTGRTNATVDFNSTSTTFLTQTSDVQAVLIQLIQNNNTPANFRTIGNIDFIAENSASSDEIYARVSCSSQDITSATEDGLLQLGVVSGGTLIASIDMEGDSAGGSLIGFFGVTPVARQSPAQNSAAIITALENLGLFV